MKTNNRSFFCLFLSCLVICFTAACGGSGGGGGTTEYVPARIVASWSGGATGNPTDRTDTKPAHWVGSLCTPSAANVSLTNYYGGFDGLTIINNCDEVNTFYICATKGSSPISPLQECAEDPFDTSLTYMKIETLNPGAPGDFINANRELSINIFYCSDGQQLVGPPVFDPPLRCM